VGRRGSGERLAGGEEGEGREAAASFAVSVRGDLKKKMEVGGKVGEKKIYTWEERLVGHGGHARGWRNVRVRMGLLALTFLVGKVVGPPPATFLSGR
jgi:hypothetical protein